MIKSKILKSISEDVISLIFCTMPNFITTVRYIEFRVEFTRNDCLKNALLQEI